MATTLEYLEDMFRYEGNAKITGIGNDKDGRPALILDKTFFYPQGGGQACDVGIIEGEGLKFEVLSVIYVDGVVLHGGNVLVGLPEVGKPIKLTIDKARREYNSRLQSGGHLLLNAMKDAGQTLVATKGYHFPDGPYVEFSGSIPENEREALIPKLQMEVDRLVGLNLPVTWQLVPPEKLHEVCANVPANVPKDKPTRVVTIDAFSQPCGGTHVRSLGELKGMKIEKIKSKKGDTRISYSIPKA
ncbi:MAG TPA: alanine--tRNA ligase-related protein [Cyclobacteriaceae bacterium]|nr:alanine--tRNA ligase-related protein [Cyclobacteriaceae bacterium]